LHRLWSRRSSRWPFAAVVQFGLAVRLLTGAGSPLTPAETAFERAQRQQRARHAELCRQRRAKAEQERHQRKLQTAAVIASTIVAEIGKPDAMRIFATALDDTV
jgi:hypothetical protein